MCSSPHTPNCLCCLLERKDWFQSVTHRAAHQSTKYRLADCVYATEPAFQGQDSLTYHRKSIWFRQVLRSLTILSIKNKLKKIPKSANLMFYCSSRSKFSGLMSLWMIFLEWICSNDRASWRMNLADVFSLNFFWGCFHRNAYN